MAAVSFADLLLHSEVLKQTSREICECSQSLRGSAAKTVLVSQETVYEARQTIESAKENTKRSADLRSRLHALRPTPPVAT